MPVATGTEDLRSASKSASLQQPGNTPRCQLILRHRLPNVWMCSVDQPAGSAAYQPRGLVGEVCDEMQHRALRQRPIDCKGGAGFELAAGAEADFRNQGHDVALSDHQQAPVQVQPVLMPGNSQLAPIEARGSHG